MTASLFHAVGAYLFAALLAPAPPQFSPQAIGTVNSTVGILTIDKRELGSKYHAAVAVSGAGDIAGHILDKKGRLVCGFVGVYNVFTDCLATYGCGYSFTNCL